jgi:hypothetical protein
MDADWWVTPEVMFLRAILDALTGGRTLLTDAERREVNPDHGRWTALSPDEVDRKLGLA